jgi:two-component system NtrC family sensor kinase
MDFALAKKKISIGVRLAVMVAALLILSSGSFAILSLMSQRREAMDMFVRSSINMSRSLERTLRFSMLENRREEIGLAVKQIGVEETIENVVLLTHNGTPVYTSGTRSQEQASLTDTGCSGCHVDGGVEALKRLPDDANVVVYAEPKVARLSVPIYNEPACYTSVCHAHSSSETVLGMMWLDVSYADIDRALRRSHIRLVGLSVLIALATSIIVLGLIRFWVTRPVKELLKGTRRVADGDLSHVIPVGEAELGALAQAFNKMQGQLLSSQRQLITAEKLASIGKLSASVAHEINNPLTGILTFAEDLVEEAPPDDPHLPDYEVIQREAIRCRDIVRELLDFSRQDKPEMRAVDVNEVVKRTIRFVSRQAIFRNITIETEPATDLPPVTADPAQLEQVILGILVNASDAMPNGGAIYVRTALAADGSEVELSIRDTGPGIPEESLPKIFEPFFSTKGGRSMGIGLAVSWNIINQHGGRLEVESPPGKGATFRIVMPCGRSAPASADAVKR